MTIRLRDFKENLTYLALWLLLFLTLVVSMVIRVSSHEYMTFDWASVFRVWKIYAIYLAIFLIHNFILAPLLIYKHKKLMYFATTIALLAVFVIFQCSQKPHRPMAPDFKHRIDMMEKEPHHGEGPAREHGAFKGEPDDIFAPLPPPDDGPMFDGKHPDRPEGRPPLSMGPADIVNTIMVVLLLGMNLGIKLYFKSDRDAKEMQLLEKQNLEQQLEYLKYQINPHFFMNTLNNIHALVDIDSEKAKETILELSKLMRYVLYEGAKSSVPLGREVAFLNNYVTLMKLRYTDKVKIHIDIPETIPDHSVPPMLFITFVENAFKHGVSYQEPSYINMEMRFVGERVHFACANSKHAESTQEFGGVGLANVKKRLELIYGDNYTLDIQDDEKEYTVKLDIHTIG
ncbi:MAG: histidine kinase [Prevotella sp.]|nr:histidine kinase [Prevotella sp.]